MAEKRADRVGANRTQFEKNARYIYKTQEVCGICGLPVDMSLKSPDPMSKTIDHIIPINKGGHPSDLSNLQLAHRCCNRQKGDKLFVSGSQNRPGIQNYPDGCNDPAVSNDPGVQNNPPVQNNPGGPMNPGSLNNPPGKPRVDNDNLPQHVDWSTYTW